MKYYLSSTEEVAKNLNVNPETGLTDEEAKLRLKEHGLNKLDDPETESLLKRFFAQMADPMIIMLIVAALISLAIGIAEGTGEFADVAIIMFVVIVNAVLGVVQESKAEEALKSLQEMSAASAKVIRNGSQFEVPTRELVPGDIVLLEAGDSVPADCRIIESATLKIEESALTGESLPVEKFSHAIECESGNVPLGDRKNMCYSGSVVVYGRGVAMVCATGMNTEMGKIADSITQAKDGETPLQIKLNELSHVLTKIVIGICLVIFATGFFQHGSDFFDLQNPKLMIDTFMVAISLAVAAIPEGLVAVVTIVLSIGVTKMSQQHAIIRKLTAVETLGCTQLICSDKTGTLTQNKMTVVRREADNDAVLLRSMSICSDARWDEERQECFGDPTEAALVTDAAKEGLTSTELDAQYPRIGEAPFDSSRKMMSVVVRHETEGIHQITKGAPDVILGTCTHYLNAEGEVVALDDAKRAEILAANKSMADEALRVLACAVRYWDAEPESFDPAFLEKDLVFVGLSGMIDPVRPEVKDAIVEAHDAGIRVVMITGDHIDTAIAIAKNLNILEDASQAITGAELDKLSEEEFFDKIVNYSVYARVQPEHKTRIVETWKKRDKVVAMTGDGVNDAPSIKRADIGIGMGITGTDVTKDVADMVLTDDNFATIVSAVEEGRRIYDNIRKAIQFLLSSNLAEVVAVFTASMVGFTILEPTHLLWINLITDCFPALAMGMELAEPNIMKRKPRDSKDGIFAGGMGIDCAFQGVVIALLTIASYFIGLHLADMPLAKAIADPAAGRMGMTMAFLTLSMIEMFHSFNMRSRRQSVFTLHTHNKWLWGSFIGSLILTYLVIEIPFFSQAFGFVNLDFKAYGIAMLLAASIIPIVEISKVVMRGIEAKKEA